MKPFSKLVQDAKVPRVTKCRACGNSNLIPCLDIGYQYLSSIFPDSPDYRSKLFRYPMDMVLCQKSPGGNECGLVQLGHELDLTDMYKHYPYTSSSNSSMNKILQDVAESGLDLGHLKAGDAVLDIGCNDGTLLSFFDGKGLTLLGIDAAHNIKPVFESPSLTIKRATFFNCKSYQEIASKKASLIFSIAMFYHLSDPVAFAKDAAECLAEDGAWIVQMAYLPAMLKTNMYDNIVHEHAGYYGIEHMQWVMEHAGLEVFDVTLNDVYGGSFRVFVKKKGNTKFPMTDRLVKHVAEERLAALFSLKTYQEFDRRIKKTRNDLRALICKIKGEGKKVWVYGASTKGNTILQYCDLGADDIVAAADANAFKFDKCLIGTDIPIKNEEEMRKMKPDYLLALPYSFVDGFMRREKDLVASGTKFIVPLPEVAVLPR